MAETRKSRRKPERPVRSLVNTAWGDEFREECRERVRELHEEWPRLAPEQRKDSLDLLVNTIHERGAMDGAQGEREHISTRPDVAAVRACLYEAAAVLIGHGMPMVDPDAAIARALRCVVLADSTMSAIGLGRAREAGHLSTDLQRLPNIREALLQLARKAERRG